MHSSRHDFWAGLWGALPFCVVVGPYGMVFGVLAAESGLDIFTAVAFSMAVIAGAAQFTALSLLQDQAPVLIVIIVGLAVNLRMAFSLGVLRAPGHRPQTKLRDLDPRAAQCCHLHSLIPSQSVTRNLRRPPRAASRFVPGLPPVIGRTDTPCGC